jgi:hypothetical protein
MRISERNAAYPGGPRALIARARRARPAYASSRLVGERAHCTHLPRSSRHRSRSARDKCGSACPSHHAMPHTSQNSRHIDVTGSSNWLSEGVKCLQAQCSAAVNQRETVASGQTREKSKLQFPIISSNVRLNQRYTISLPISAVDNRSVADARRILPMAIAMCARGSRCSYGAVWRADRRVVAQVVATHD